MSRSPRPGFTAPELLVVIAMVAVLAGLLLPAIQKVREASNRAQCINNLRQIIVGFHNAHNEHGCFPPGIGYYGKAYGTGAFHLLPYVEEGNLYAQSAGSGGFFAGYNDVFARPVKVYLCPSDPSPEPGGLVTDGDGVAWGATSYAGNTQVWCTVDSAGRLINPSGAARLGSSFPDGAANTIVMAEKYARCTGYGRTVGGTAWAYWVRGKVPVPLHPGFAGSWSQYSIGPRSHFLVRPTPFLGGCDPVLASTPHAAGINVALADASVRTLAPTISGTTWWAACTPKGGETLGQDW